MGGRVRILITGDKGFVGTETKKVLEVAGHTVYGYDIMDGFDIRDKKTFEAVIERGVREQGLFVGSVPVYGFNAVLHLAAIARFSDADKDPKLAFETNVLGTKNVVEVCKKYHIPLVYASTGSAIMPLNGYEPPFDESIPARGNSVYGCTKALGEYLVKEHTPHIILRYGHLYGAEKRMHGAISGFMDRMQRGLRPTLFGGQQTNSFVYIKDVARANVLALTANWDCWNNVYNVGSPEELSTESVFETMKELTGYKGEIEKLPQRTVDAERFAFDVSKAKKMLNFETEWQFKDGIRDMLKEMSFEQN
jgi:UDP-glucose 4-epimerase